MRQIFDFKSIESELGEGEIHLHEAQRSCSSIFRSPNSGSLKGIAPHIHDNCDDIEILLRGSIILPAAPGRGYCVSAPALIINRAGEPHGFVSGENGAAVLGVRCPKDYRGHSVSRDEAVVWCERVLPLDNARTRVVHTANCIIQVQVRSEAGGSLHVASHPRAEYVGVLMCEHGSLSFLDGTKHAVDGSALVFSYDDNLRQVDVPHGGRLIEILPKQSGGLFV